MIRLLAGAALLALVCSAAALAGRGDPQERLTPADQARAKAMLLRRSDFASVFSTVPARSGENDFYCAALDESKLTLTGKAASPTFQGGVEFVSSLSRVYRTAAESAASWKLGSTAAGDACARREFQRQFRALGARLVSFTRVSFPRFAERSQRYRLVISTQGVQAFVDAVALKQGRAQVALLLGSGLTPMPLDEEIRLARVAARRMATAMKRG